ncbi:flagellar hook-length control protein FliK [Duganella sp.]|uniref:flagellar hook-length control protein FliK n=1 Tax=Duganella sp. TaxID=1904440 RepID=UPI0031D7BEFB
MLPRLDAATVTPVKPADGAGAGVAIGDGRQAAFQRAVQSLVGQTVPAEVMSKLKDGSYLVKVADNAVRLMLPGDTQVGTSVPLTVLSAQPRPTFQLGNSAPGSAPTLLYTDGGMTEGGEAASLPSQGAAVYLPGSGKPPAGAGQAGLPGQPAAGGDGAAAADGEAMPGQTRPGAATTPAGGAAGNPNATAAGARPGLPAGAAATPDNAAAPAAGRPAVPAGATPNPAAALATPAGAVQAQAAATLAAGNAAAGIAVDAAKPQSLAATLLGKAPLTPAHELPALTAHTPQATLSSAARVLTTILSSTAQAGQAAQVALVGKTALFGNAAPDTDVLAQKLHDTISKSGLFYESHVAEWAKGERPLADLMREPQMQRLLQQGGEAARAATGGPDLSAAQMINQQLHTQEQHRVLWQGQAWPGQDMQWEVRRDQREGRQDGGGDAEAGQEQIWRSGVRFRLPMLGAVSAAVTLIGDQVHIQVQTDTGNSATTLRAYAGQLESAMAAAGAQLSSLTISQEDGHDG